jgi:catechol 2,3-dioxygenase-like lactoylglutathione lyase family enzyme
MRYARVVGLCGLLLASSVVGAEVDGTVELSVAALRLSATDIDESTRFYATHFGFEMAGDYSSEGFVVLVNGDVPLVITGAEAPVSFTDGMCHTRFNFAVADLGASVATMKAAGVRFVGDGRSAVGAYATFEDPSGHRHNLEQLDEPIEGRVLARVYNAGIGVLDMDKAMAFYEGVLGMPVFSRDYYPPAMVFDRTGVSSFILSDKAVSSRATYTPDAFSGLAFETADIVSTMATLRERGVEFFDETPVNAGPVLVASFQDPFGNVHELIEHVAPEANSAAPEIDDLAFLEGRWVYESEGDVMEEIWMAPREGNMTGALRHVADAKTSLLELFTVTKGDDGVLTYRLRHFDGELRPWASEIEGPMVATVTEAGNGRCVLTFDGTRVETIVYELKGNEIDVSINFPESRGREPLRLNFKRQ